MGFWEDLLHNVSKGLSGGGPSTSTNKPTSSPAPKPSAPSGVWTGGYRPNADSSAPASGSSSGGGGGGQRAAVTPTNFDNIVQRTGATKNNQKVESQLPQDDPTAGVKNDPWKPWNDFWGGLNEQMSAGSDFDKSTRDYANLYNQAQVAQHDPFGIATKQHQNFVQDKADQEAHDSYASKFQAAPNMTVQEVSQADWDAMTPQQQKGIIANYALYQASLADKALPKDASRDTHYNDDVSKLFGDKGGSDSYAPNTVKVLQDLGFKNSGSEDLDEFLNGGVLNNSWNTSRDTPSTQARADLFNRLANASNFSGDNVTAAEGAGLPLLDALRRASNFSDDFLKQAGVGLTAAGQLTEAQRKLLDNAQMGMRRKDVWDQIQSDPNVNNALKSTISEAYQGIDPKLATQYMLENYQADTTDPNQMSFEDFKKNWIQEG
jgi:hypothetical protein